jgi:hypothetical protein
MNVLKNEDGLMIAIKKLKKNHKKKSKETPILTRLVRDMLLTYKNITIVTEKGIDCDENYTV